MPEYLFGLFTGGIAASLAIAAIAARSKSERIPPEEVEARIAAAVETAKTEAFRQGRIAQAVIQAEKDSNRAKKAARTREAQRNAPDHRGAP